MYGQKLDSMDYNFHLTLWI